MKIEIGKKYKLTMPKNGEFINITRDEALRGTDGSGIITIESVQDNRTYGMLALIKESGFWISYDYLSTLHKILKYNKEHQCPNLL